MKVRIIKEAPPAKIVSSHIKLNSIDRLIGREFEVLQPLKNGYILIRDDKGKPCTIFEGEYEEVTEQHLNQKSSLVSSQKE
jgi:hypothetical protein